MIIFFIVVALFCSALWLFFLRKKKKVSSGNLHNLGRNIINRDTKSLSGNYQSAIADYNRAIVIEPELAKAYNNRAIAKSTQGDTRGAILDLRKAAELSKAQGDMILYQNTIDTIEYLQQ